MSHKPGVITVTALCVGFAMTSCTLQPTSPTQLAIQKDELRPSMLTVPGIQEGKHLSIVGTESDCILTTGDIHFWCKWIDRYY
jgi:hypothetical protein